MRPLDNLKLLVLLTFYFYWTARIFIGATGVIYRESRLFPASSAFPQAAAHRVVLTTYKSGRRADGPPQFCAFDEFTNYAGSEALTV